MSAQIYQFDPAKTPHYCLSEEAFYRLRRVTQALSALSLIHDQQDDLQLSGQALGSITQSLSFALDTVLVDETPFHTPVKPEKKT